MKSHFLRERVGVVSVEIALIFPVILFIIMMFFELARIALLITLVDVSIEKSVQGFRENASFSLSDEEDIKDEVRVNIIDNSFGFIDIDNIDVELQKFSNLNEFSGVYDSEENYYSLPVLNFIIFLNEEFITPLPSFFGLGNSFQHEYRHVLGDLMGETAK